MDSKNRVPAFWVIIISVIVTSGLALAQSVMNPKQTYGRMTLAPATATKVPATCMTPRTSLFLYNLDSAQVCCGGDSNVTCANTANGGYPIPAGGAGISVPLNCNPGSDAGVVWCYSALGTGTFLFGWWETN